MAKRIYWQTILKKAAVIGIPVGITSVALLFWYLSFIGAIVVTGHSGDSICAGTIENPCYAYINFTANEDIFIYPFDYDPWERDTPFYTDEGLKSWKMYRSWGTGWREIKLNETCKYTWCGAPPNSPDNKYAFAFREGRDYQIRIVALKEDPKEDIKWGFGPVDPVWYGVDEGEIGYNILNDTVVIWNKNDAYYFDKTSGIQLTNHYEDYWSKNIFCIGYYSGEEWIKIKCADELSNFNRNIHTDNLTYVNATLWKDITYGSYDIRLGINYYLGLDDKNLSITIYGKNTGIDIPFDLGFAWKVQNLNVPPETTDQIKINNTNYELDGIYDLTFKDMKKEIESCSPTNETTSNGTIIYNCSTIEVPIPFYKVYDREPGLMGKENFLRIDWDENLNYAVKMYGEGNQSNFYTALLINAGHFSPNQEKSTTFYWIDALVDDIMGYWTLDDVYTDSSGNGLTLTPVNSPTFAAGKINNGSDLEVGSSQHLTRATSSLYPTLPFSINLWVKPESVTGLYQYLVSKWVDTAGRDRYGIRIDAATDKFTISSRNAAQGSVTVTSTTSAVPGNWYMVTFVANSTHLLLYVNGELEGTPAILADSHDDVEQPFYMGANGAGTAQFTDGVIDEVGVWDKALSSTEVEDLYNSGDGFPYPFIPADTTSPTYSDNQTNSTEAGQPILFSILYNDTIALHPKGQYIFSTNNTGSWANESTVNFTATPQWANVTKTLNSTAGLVIGYRWYADDNQDNINNTGIYTLTTTDSFAPVVTLNSPIDDYNSSSQTITFNGTSYDNLDLENVSLYGNWSSWHLNETNSTPINNTPVIFIKTISDGIYVWNYYACDSVNNCSFGDSNRTFLIDTTYPQISIIYPANDTYTVNVTDLNYTYTEINLYSCWYSLDGGVTNSSLDETCANYTNLTSVEGNNTWTIYINDSAGNVNSSSVSFTKDTEYPLIDYAANSDPLNESGNFDVQDWVFVNVTVTEANEKNISFILWTLDGTYNETTYNASTTQGYEYYDDFETDFGHWAVHEGINCPDLDAWGRRDTSTVSSGTGPQNGGVGGAGTYFIYVETSSGSCYDTGDMAIVYFNTTIDYDSYSSEKIEFYFDAYGSQIDKLALEENSTGSWIELWNMSDINNDYWNFTSVDLSSLTGSGTLRFNYTRTSTGWGSDIALDRINVTYTLEGSSVRTINWTSLPESMYFWNVTVCDILSQCNTTITRRYGVETINVSVEGLFTDLDIELGTSLTINATNTNDTICVDIDHPNYGTNYSCVNQKTSFELLIDYFRKIVFNDSSTSKLLNFSGLQIHNFSISSHQYDEADNLSINISGINNPTDVAIYGSNTTDLDRVFHGFLNGSNIYLNKFFDESNATNLTYSNPGSKSVYFYLDDNIDLFTFLMNVTGTSYGFSYEDNFSDFDNIDTSLTNAQLDKSGTIQSANSSLQEFSFDDFEDDSIASHWIYSDDFSYDEECRLTRTTSETDGYLKQDNSLYDPGENCAGNSLMWIGPNETNLNLYTSDNITFNLSSDYDSTGELCGGNTYVDLGEENAWTSSYLSDVGSLHVETSDADMSFALSKYNTTHWRVLISGLETSTVYQADNCKTGNAVWNWTSGLYSIIWGDCADDSGSLDNDFFIESNYSYGLATTIRNGITFTGGCAYNDVVTKTYFYNNTKWNRTNGTVISKSIFDSASDIVSATLTVYGISNPDEDVFGYLSADNGVHWESVSSGLEHTFSAPNRGKNVKWRLDFNLTNGTESTYKNQTTIITNVTVSTPEGNLSDITFDFGKDGIIDYTIDGELNSTNSPYTVNLSSADLSSAFTSLRDFYDHTYKIPLVISSDIGQLNIDTINLTYNPNPISLNTTYIQTFLDNSLGFVDFLISIGSTGGNITVDDVRYDYAGGNKTYTVLAHNDDYSINTSRNLTYYYSGWDYELMPLYVDYLEFIPQTPTSKNVTPFGQTIIMPILNITNYGYGGKNTNLSIYLNETLDCVNLTISLTENKSDGFIINDSWQNLTGLTYLETINISMWADFECNYTNWYLFNPFLYFRQCGVGCYCSEDLE